MYERPYELVGAPDSLTARVRARGNDVLRNPMLNRGTAFSWERTDRAEDLKAALT